ncbi:MAG: hypothetical protein VYA27_13320 [Verrucomicrobiota bacterium]|nr:hypothetical protein [Verrucomicrobiota bacterium]
MLLLQVAARLARPVLLVVRVVSRLRLRVVLLVVRVVSRLRLRVVTRLVVLLVVRVVSRLRLRVGRSSLIHLPVGTATNHRGSTRQRSDRSAVRLPKGPRVDLGQIPLVVS